MSKPRRPASALSLARKSLMITPGTDRFPSQRRKGTISKWGIKDLQAHRLWNIFSNKSNFLPIPFCVCCWRRRVAVSGASSAFIQEVDPRSKSSLSGRHRNGLILSGACCDTYARAHSSHMRIAVGHGEEKTATKKMPRCAKVVAVTMTVVSGSLDAVRSPSAFWILLRRDDGWRVINEIGIKKKCHVRCAPLALVGSIFHRRRSTRPEDLDPRPQGGMISKWSAIGCL